MIVRDRVRDVLQQYGLAGARRRHDQRALAFANRCDDVDDARREILLGRIFEFHLQPLVGIERRQIVEVDLVARLLGVFEVQRIDLEQRKIPLALLWAADVAVDRVAGAKSEPPDLRGRNVDVVRTGQVVRFRRAQKAEAVRQHLHHALTDNIGLAGGELLQDAEHQLLFAHGRGILDLELFGKRDQLSRALCFEFLEFHFPHAGISYGNGASGRDWTKGAGGRRKKQSRRSWTAGVMSPRTRCQVGSDPLEPELNCIRLRSVG